MQPLSEPIYFQNSQWAVTSYGIERTDGCYVIEANRLTETEMGNGCYSWPMHLSRTKARHDAVAFGAAFAVALIIHAGKYKPAVKPDMFARSITAAIKLAARNQAIRQEIDRLDLTFHGRFVSLTALHNVVGKAEAIVDAREKAGT
jgi:hypothetical protein